MARTSRPTRGTGTADADARHFLQDWNSGCRCLAASEKSRRENRNLSHISRRRHHWCRVFDAILIGIPSRNRVLPSLTLLRRDPLPLSLSFFQKKRGTCAGDPYLTSKTENDRQRDGGKEVREIQALDVSAASTQPALVPCSPFPSSPLDLKICLNLAAAPAVVFLQHSMSCRHTFASQENAPPTQTHNPN